MAIDRPLEEAWQASLAQFEQLEQFVNDSAANRPQGDLEYRTLLYRGWVLLAYATTEGAIQQQGEACVALLGRLAATPADLPERVRREHHRQTLAYLSDHTSGRRSVMSPTDFEGTMASLNAGDWSEYTRLLMLERNVWPDAVSAWLGRLSETHNLGWMRTQLGGGADTLRSGIIELIEERNQLAHGQVPATTQDPSVVDSWIDAATFYVRQVARTFQLWVVNNFVVSEARPSIGTIDGQVSATLGTNTFAVSAVENAVRVGDELCIWDNGARLARVTSMQSHGTPLDSIAPGDAEIAISVHRPIPANAHVHCLP